MGGVMAAARSTRPLPLTPADDDLCGPPITDVPLSDADAAVLAAVLAALADPVRLRLISIVADQGEVCSCNLEQPLGKSQTTISHHTRVLGQAGLIEGDKHGKWNQRRMVA